MNFNTYKIKFIANKEQILYINSVLDSYEGIGIMRTIDKNKGLVCIYSTEILHKQALAVLSALKREGVMIENITIEVSEDVDSW